MCILFLCPFAFDGSMCIVIAFVSLGFDDALCFVYLLLCSCLSDSLNIHSLLIGLVHVLSITTTSPFRAVLCVPVVLCCYVDSTDIF